MCRGYAPPPGYVPTMVNPLLGADYGAAATAAVAVAAAAPVSPTAVCRGARQMRRRTSWSGRTASSCRSSRAAICAPMMPTRRIRCRWVRLAPVRRHRDTGLSRVGRRPAGLRVPRAGPGSDRPAVQAGLRDAPHQPHRRLHERDAVTHAGCRQCRRGCTRCGRFTRSAPRCSPRRRPIRRPRRRRVGALSRPGRRPWRAIAAGCGRHSPSRRTADGRVAATELCGSRC